MNETSRNVIDMAAITTAFGSWLSWLPEIAALFAIIWTLIRIYEWMRVRVFKKPPTKGIDL